MRVDRFQGLRFTPLEPCVTALKAMVEGLIRFAFAEAPMPQEGLTSCDSKPFIERKDGTAEVANPVPIET